MVDAYRVILGVHIAAALVALASFWVAVALPKGGPRHVRTGRLYVRAMTVMLATAGVLSVALAAAPATFAAPDAPLAGETLAAHLEETRTIGVLLVVITLVTASFLWFGVRAPRRRSTRLAARRLDLAVLAAPGLLGLLAVPLSAVPGWHVLDGFGIALVVTSALLVRRVLRPAPWLREHLVGLLGSGVVIHGAVATNLGRQAGLEGLAAFAAAGPVVALGVVLTVRACGRYTSTLRRREPLGGVATQAR